METKLLKKEMYENEKIMKNILPTKSWKEKAKWAKLYKRNAEIVKKLNSLKNQKHNSFIY